MECGDPLDEELRKRLAKEAQARAEERRKAEALRLQKQREQEEAERRKREAAAAAAKKAEEERKAQEAAKAAAIAAAAAKNKQTEYNYSSASAKAPSTGTTQQRTTTGTGSSTQQRTTTGSTSTSQQRTTTGTSATQSRPSTSVTTTQTKPVTTTTQTKPAVTTQTRPVTTTSTYSTPRPPVRRRHPFRNFLILAALVWFGYTQLKKRGKLPDFSKLFKKTEAASEAQSAEEAAAAAEEAYNEGLAAGDWVYFGNYVQNPDNGGTQPIEWLVLDTPNDSTVTLISRFCIECGLYNTELTSTTWESSYLRQFLNEEFYNNAFSEDEKALITYVVNENEDNPVAGTNGGSGTNDRVYILSASEAAYYFPTDAGRRGTATAYTTQNGIYVNKDKRTSPWFVRTPGETDNKVMYVASDGEIRTGGSKVTDTDGGVRPVVTLNISTDQAKSLVVKKVPVDPGDASYGDFVLFGSYEQDGDTSNGQEPIEWISLGGGDDYVLLISRYVLDTHNYSNDSSATWETSELRRWLNEDFYQAAFSEEDMQRMWSVDVSTENNPSFGTSGGNKTSDYVFILSLDEADSFFISEVDRLVYPTEYALQQGVFTAPSNGCATWFTRTPGKSASFVDYVYSWGEIDYKQNGYGVNEELKGVRPVIMVKIGE